MENVRYLTEENGKSTATIVAQIFENLQKLISQEIALAKKQMGAEYAKLKGLFALFVGMAVSFAFALVLATLALVHLFSSAGMSDWAVYGLVALLYLAAGLSFYFISQRLSADEGQSKTASEGETYAA